MNSAGCSWRIAVSRCLRGRSGYASRISSAWMNVSSSGSGGSGGERREPLAHEALGLLQHLPERAHGVGQVVEGAVGRGDRALPVPLVDVHRVVVVEEVVLAHGPHVGEEALAGLHPELGERRPLPLRRGLDDLGVDRVRVAVVRDVEPHGRARAVAVEVVVDAARGVHDQRHLHERQVQLLAEAVLDQPLGAVERLHRLLRREQRRVVVRQHLLELGVVADPRACEVGFLGNGHRSSDPCGRSHSRRSGTLGHRCRRGTECLDLRRHHA